MNIWTKHKNTVPRFFLAHAVYTVSVIIIIIIIIHMLGGQKFVLFCFIAHVATVNLKAVRDSAENVSHYFCKDILFYL